MSIEKFIENYYVERAGTNSVKWDGMNERFSTADLLPLWVADMDFKVPKEVQAKMIERIEHGVFGYSLVSDSYYNSFMKWQKKRHNIEIKKEWIRFTTGVVNSFNYLIQAFSQENESVIILAPVYYPFYDAIINNNRQLVVSHLENNKGIYGINFEQFEADIIENKVKLFLHCSPQNPVGRVWSKNELERLLEICLKHGVKVISDEIHQDFIQPGQEFISTLSVEEKYLDHLFVLSAPSKTFNIASLLHSHLLIPNQELRSEYDLFAEKAVNNTVSLMGTIATEAAYTYGSEWLDELIEVIEHNYKVMSQLFEKELPHVVVSPKEATYLAWVDLSYYLKEQDIVNIMEEKAKIAVDYGEWFDANHSSFIRINLATKTENIVEATQKLISFLKV
ncbi:MULTISPECIES: MalY/PatB family protein [Vagococcus]|uniref:cysteine-S-conjugate beta-lyase n=1 Tax=Vagococcus fluvialis bH819 TaxID=1255619 RepID=A0A1X6WPW1_9ENTE|nr:MULTISPECIES: MalY/PatB family protein [Vagococcus]SLM86319.1 Aspartate aminotransferase [Vagococcus fluvialis bH819]HCM88971.1 pyridoxal phosphate-dependent aminotransferase [Vagococcus sp.]